MTEEHRVFRSLRDVIHVIQNNAFHGPREVAPVDVFVLQTMRVTLRFWRCTNRCCAAVRKHGLYGTARTQAGATEVDLHTSI